jgi:ATP-binding cassette, subfamily B, bacterial MsbA
MENSAVIKRLLNIMRPYRARALLALLAMAGTASTQPMLVKAMQALIDNGFGAQRVQFSLWLVPAVLISIFGLRGIFTFSTAYLNNWVISRTLNDLRRAMFDRLLRLPVARFHQESTGTLINTIIGDVRQVVDMVNSVFLAFVRDTLSVIGLLATLFYLNWRLTLVALVIVPLTAGIVRLTTGRLRRLNRENQRVTGEMTQVVEEAARGHQVIRVFSGERYERRRFEARSEALRGFSQRMTVAAAATVPVTQIATAVAVSVVIVLALQQKMTPGEFTAFITSMLMLLAPLKSLVEVNGPLQRGMAAAETVFAMMDAPVEADPGTKVLGRARGHLRFERVSFAYSPAGAPALADVTLDIAPGETIALVGISGGGKSTLVNLVTRFYAPTAGRISLDGIAFDDITLASLRAQLAMVSQNVVLFDDTLGANIAYGVDHVDQKKLAAAVEAAHLADVVASLPDGLDTMIGENGMRLSGGQRQRVAIARAIYKDAPILILDEATSALDTESERAVQAALETLMAGRTTLVIAHRLSTIERADRIVVMDHGRILEAGSHEQLLEKNGLYARLYHLQFAKDAA